MSTRTQRPAGTEWAAAAVAAVNLVAAVSSRRLARAGEAVGATVMAAAVMAAEVVTVAAVGPVVASRKSQAPTHHSRCHCSAGTAA